MRRQDGRAPSGRQTRWGYRRNTATPDSGSRLRKPRVVTAEATRLQNLPRAAHGRYRIRVPSQCCRDRLQPLLHLRGPQREGMRQFGLVYLSAANEESIHDGDPDAAADVP